MATRKTRKEKAVNRQELAELILVYLYDKAEAEAHSFFFFPLSEFASLAGIKDDTEMLAAARSLEDQGLVMLSQDFMGQISAFINLDGTVYAEKGGQTGIIAKYREDPQAFLKESDGPMWLQEPELDAAIVQFSPEMVSPVEAPEAPVETGAADVKPYIISIINAILDETSIDDVTRADLLRDAESLNIQLAKTTKNRDVIRLLMAELASFPSLAHLTAELSSFVS
jgi:hypothetical protein